MNPVIVLTRPLAQSKRFAEELAESLDGRAEIVISPLLQISYIPFDPVPADRDVIFTSENGVSGFVEGADAQARRAFCVGDRTAEVARAHGFEALSASGTATDLINLIAQDGGGEMVYARGAHVSRDLRVALAAIGVPVSERVVYSQDALDLSAAALEAIGGAKRVIFPLFSRRSMELLCSQEMSGRAAQRFAVCISSSVAKAAPVGAFDNVTVCDAPNSRSMIEALRGLSA